MAITYLRTKVETRDDGTIAYSTSFARGPLALASSCIYKGLFMSICTYAEASSGLPLTQTDSMHYGIRDHQYGPNDPDQSGGIRFASPIGVLECTRLIESGLYLDIVPEPRELCRQRN